MFYLWKDSSGSLVIYIWTSSCNLRLADLTKRNIDHMSVVTRSHREDETRYNTTLKMCRNVSDDRSSETSTDGSDWRARDRQFRTTRKKNDGMTLTIWAFMWRIAQRSDDYIFTCREAERTSSSVGIISLGLSDVIYGFFWVWSLRITNTCWVQMHKINAESKEMWWSD